MNNSTRPIPIELGASELPELLDYLSDELCRPEMAIDAAKTYFRSIAK